MELNSFAVSPNYISLAYICHCLSLWLRSNALPGVYGMKTSETDSDQTPQLALITVFAAQFV
jgi:hypothetical protein